MKISESALRSMIMQAVKESYDYDDEDSDTVKSFLKNPKNQLPKDSKKAEKNAKKTAMNDICGRDNKTCKHQPNKDCTIDKIVEESIKKVLKEGTTDEYIINKWYELEETIGAEQMLDCIFHWSSSDQLEQYIKWFKEEEYFNDEEM